MARARMRGRHGVDEVGLPRHEEHRRREPHREHRHHEHRQRRSGERHEGGHRVDGAGPQQRTALPDPVDERAGRYGEEQLGDERRGPTVRAATDGVAPRSSALRAMIGHDRTAADRRDDRRPVGRHRDAAQAERRLGGGSGRGIPAILAWRSDRRPFCRPAPASRRTRASRFGPWLSSCRRGSVARPSRATVAGSAGTPRRCLRPEPDEAVTVRLRTPPPLDREMTGRRPERRDGAGRSRSPTASTRSLEATAALRPGRRRHTRPGVVRRGHGGGRGVRGAGRPPLPHLLLVRHRARGRRRPAAPARPGRRRRRRVCRGVGPRRGRRPRDGVGRAGLPRRLGLRASPAGRWCSAP